RVRCSTGGSIWDRSRRQYILKVAYSPMMVSRNLSHSIVMSATKLYIVQCCTGDPPIGSGRRFVEHSGQFRAAKGPKTTGNHFCPDLDGPTTVEYFIQVQAGIGFFGNLFLILA